MRRFFIPSDHIAGDTAWIDGSDVNHLHHVLRKDVGDSIEATDGAGHVLTVQLTSVFPERIDFRILDRRELARLDTQIRVFQAIPRGTSMEMLIEKLTELGTTRIVPLMTERTVPVYTGDKALKKQERWQRLAHETAKKMGAGAFTTIDPVITLKEMAGTADPASLKILAWEVEQSRTLKQLLQSEPLCKNIDIIIGPEGGFTQKEIDLLLGWGYEAVSLGSRVLKVATASLVAVANILYEREMD